MSNSSAVLPLEIEIARPALEQIARKIASGSEECRVVGGTYTIDGRERVVIASASDGGGRPIRFAIAQSPRSETPTVVLTQGGLVEFPDTRIDNLRVIGPGLHRVARDPIAEAIHGEAFSRLRGALGSEALETLQSLRVAIVGCGRIGSLLASSLARLHVAELTLIDPDNVEGHNLDAMDGVSASDIGRRKVHAVAAGLRAQGGANVVAIPHTVSCGLGIDAVKRADVLVSCADHALARASVAVLASLYMKPLLDIGVGIARSAGGGLERGADVRLVLPGEGRCVACFGGIAQSDQMIVSLTGEVQDERWNVRRLGSLRSLNQIAGHLGLTLLEDLARDAISGSSWLRFAADDREGPRIEKLSGSVQSACPVCALSGRADVGLGLLPRTIRVMARRMLLAKVGRS